ncbi:MAG: Spy/CpxP family protein refolding chaperone, partial [Rhizomicrobium sp.]
MKTATKLILTAAAAGLLFAQPLSAQTSTGSHEGSHEGHHMAFMHGGGSPFMMLLKSANLTEAQHAQLHQIMESERSQMKSVYQQSRAIHEQIADKLLASGTVNASDLAPLEKK